MKILFVSSALLIGAVGLLAAHLGVGRDTFAGPEEDCDALPDESSSVQSNGAPFHDRTTTANAQREFSITHDVVWCYGPDLDFGSFENLMAVSEHVSNIIYSPLYFFPTTHYGTLEVAISGDLDELESTGTLESRVNVVYPYSFQDMTLTVNE